MMKLMKQIAASSIFILGNIISLSAFALTVPATTSVEFQTSGRERPPTIGDWYNANGTGSTDHVHRFLVEVTAAQLAACGGSCSVVVNDAESASTTNSTGPCDEVDGNACTAPGTSDPTRFTLRDATGTTVLQSQTINTANPADGTTVTFAITAVGTYQVTSEDGAYPISGDATVNLNNDDNGFTLTVQNAGGATGGFVGELQTSFQQNTTANLNYNLYFLVGPTLGSTTALKLRNFDLDKGDTGIVYTSPGGTATAGTDSNNGVWNGAGGTIDAGADNLTAASNAAAGGADVGVWQYTINGWTPNNQTVFEANGAQRLSLSDIKPVRAGNFTMTPPTTRNTAIGTPVDHPFTVTNNFFTTDIINFTLSGTSANFTTALYVDNNNNGIVDAGDTLLTDTDGDGKVDTGILQPAGSAGNAKNLILRVTPNTGAFGADKTTISGLSYMDNKVDPTNNTIITVVKTTYLTPTIAKAFSAPSTTINTNVTLTFTVTNPNGTALTGLVFTDAYPTGLVNSTPLTKGGTCTGVTSTATAGGTSFNVTAGGVPAGTNATTPGTCTITVVVKTTSSGSFSNTTSGITTTQTVTASPVSNTAVLTVASSITVTKTIIGTVFDPVNGTNNPKAIPGGRVSYGIQLTNTSTVAADSNTVTITDAVPANTEFYVNDVGATGSGPVAFVNGTPASGLTYTFTSLASTTDDISFSSDNGATYTYTPVANANGTDPAVTNIKVNPKGTFAAASGAGNPNFQIRFQVRIK